MNSSGRCQRAACTEEIRELDPHCPRREGMAVMAHVNGADAVRAAALAGADSAEHGKLYRPGPHHAMKEKGTVWVPTLCDDRQPAWLWKISSGRTGKDFDSARANVSCAWKRACCLQPEAMPEPTGCCTVRGWWMNIRYFAIYLVRQRN